MTKDSDKKILRPSQTLLDLLGFIPEKPVISREINLTKITGNYTPLPMIKELLGIIKRFYGETIGELFEQKFSLVTHESLENSRVHGSKKGRKYGITLYLCKRGTISGFWDDGEFFRGRGIKEQFESRTKIREEQFELAEDDERAGRMGAQTIYGYADIIEVDNK